MSENNEAKEQAEIKTVPFIQPWRIFSIEAFLFCLTLLLGIVTAFRINEVLKFQKIIIPPLSFWQFLFYFLLATSFILLLAFFGKFKKGKGVIFKGLFVIVSSFGGMLFLSLWLPAILTLVLIFILIFWWLKKPSVLIHDLCMIFGIAGVGSVLGLRLDPLIVIAFLILFSIYDFIAVYKTKHMIKMAKEMIESRAILALIIPQDISGFRERLEKIESDGKFLILGGGDIVFPLLFAASLVPEGILNSSIIVIFSLFGLGMSFWFFISQKIRQPIPALPPIAFFSIIGFLITLALK